MQRIPHQIEGRNFVGEEFNDEHGSRWSNDPPARQNMQRGRKRNHGEVPKQSQGGDGSINVKSGGKAGPYYDGENLAIAEGCG